MNNLQKKHLYLIGGWFIVNFLQAAFTGLHSDESYYWMYSENLNWGYFDHPPMVALLIHLGHMLVPGELGVRLFFILVSTFSFAIIIDELNEKKDLFFLGLFVVSFPLIHTHVAGFLAIPDIPLLFFALLFLKAYRRFLNRPTWLLAATLGFLAAAMIYSKYHAFIIIGLTLLSNIRLLKEKYIYGIIILTSVLLLPHILWQINHEFPTFSYHLVERAKPFQLKYVFPNLVNQLIMAGPLTGVLVFWKLSRFKIKNSFDRALIFNILGFYILFFLLSFKNRIEAHWSAAIIPMLMIATWQGIQQDPKTKKWFKRLAVPVVALLFLFRIYLALDVIPNIGHLKITFYNREAHALEIKEKAAGKKVGFFNNYAATSNYIFYTGDSAVLLSTPSYRFCQYDLWKEEKYADGDPLFAVQSKHLNPPRLERMVTGQIKGFVEIEQFQSLIGLDIIPKEIRPSEKELNFIFQLLNNTKDTVFTRHISEPVLAVKQEDIEIQAVPLTSSSHPTAIPPGEVAVIRLTVPANQLSKKLPAVFYTRSKENIRGEIIGFSIDERLANISLP